MRRGEAGQCDSRRRPMALRAKYAYNGRESDWQPAGKGTNYGSHDHRHAGRSPGRASHGFRGLCSQLRVAAAVKWYELRHVTQERAAKIAGLSRTEFLAVLGQFGVTPFQYTAEEALEEAGRE